MKSKIRGHKDFMTLKLAKFDALEVTLMEKQILLLN